MTAALVAEEAFPRRGNSDIVGKDGRHQALPQWLGGR